MNALSLNALILAFVSYLTLSVPVAQSLPVEQEKPWPFCAETELGEETVLLLPVCKQMAD